MTSGARGSGRWTVFAGLVAVLVVAAACSGIGRWRTADRDPATTYMRACASCHGVDGRGNGPVASALRVPPPDLTAIGTRHGGTFPRAYVIAVISGERELPSHGTREMPVWSERFGPGSGAAAVASFYARRRLEMLADYVESIQR